ncbi:MAG: hypothetical protein A2020_03555 [Lentisphaerae bacterium GWF2_45_14]|nr:MAG: hypothetical protein A2020_03555 [Lentisphaerae bacterium GWF2_45_14]
MLKMTGRGFIRTGIAATIILFLNIGLSAKEEQSFFFVVLADPQIGFFEKNLSVEKDSELFKKAVNSINKLRPAFVVICGDMINDARPGKIRELQLETFYSILKEIDKKIPVYLAPGNHELTLSPKPEQLDWYRKTFGKDYYKFCVNNWQFIVINTSLIPPKFVEAETIAQKEWLKKTLESSPENLKNKTIVFQHLPFFLKDSSEADDYYNIPLCYRKEYLDILKSNGVRCVIAGHYHRCSEGKDGELQMVTCGPAGKPAYKARSGIMVVYISEDKDIFHRFFPYEDIPQNITLKAFTELKND